MNRVRNKLGQLLLAKGLVTQADLHRALEHQRLTGGRLGTTLLELAAIQEEPMLESLGEFYDAPTASAQDLIDIPRNVLEVLPRELARRYTIVPFHLRGKTLHVASPQPLDLSIESEIAALSSRLIRSAVALEVRISEALHRYYGEPVPVRMIGLMRRLASGDALRDTQPLARRDSSMAATAPGNVIVTGAELEVEISGSPADAPPPDQSSGPAADPSDAPEARDQWISGSESDEEAMLVGSVGKLVFDPDDEQSPPDPRSERHHPAAAVVRGFDRRSALDPEVEISGDDDDRAVVAASVVPDHGAPLVGTTLVALRDATERDEVATALIDGFATHFCHRLLLTLRSGEVSGWAGGGLGLVERRIRDIRFNLVDCSPLLALEKGSPFWLGPLGDTAAAEQIRFAFRGRSPSVCLIAPMRVAGRTVGFFYLDNGVDGFAAAPLAEVQRVAEESGHALGRIILDRTARRNETATGSA